MNLNYDSVTDAVYLNVNSGKIKKTIEVDDKVIVDLGDKGNIVGIEILNFSNQQSKKKLKKYVADGVPFKITDATPVVA